MNKTLFKDIPLGATFVYKGSTYYKVSITTATDTRGNSVEFSQYHTVVWHKNVQPEQHQWSIQP